MKVSRLGKQRAERRLDQVMRPVFESHKNYRWWLFQETEPAEGYVLDEYIRWEPAYPQAPKTATRIPKREKLSRTALRKRLYRAHVPKSLWPELLANYAYRSLMQMAGEPTIRERHGYAIAKAVTRHVYVRLLVLDEYHAYAQPGLAGLAELFRQCRSVNAVSLTATQSLADFPEAAQKLQSLALPA
jgi:phage tail protein X